jgi:hypothetical protein
MRPAVKPPLFMLVFFSIFGFIGVTLLVFLWSSGDGFGSPPLVFKVFGGFIAFGFMAMGFGVPLASIKKGRDLRENPEPDKDPIAGAYHCPNCAANVRDANVSPSGDVKCPYCKGWWNIHRG